MSQAIFPNAPTLVLASASPRRRELLRAAGLQFEIQPADIHEAHQPGEGPGDLAGRLAREKALAVAQRLGGTEANPGAAVVLGADTVVALAMRILEGEFPEGSKIQADAHPSGESLVFERA